MKVILQADVKNIGKKGEIVEVADGYGRNFLLPKKLALPASAENVNVAKAQAGAKARKDADALAKEHGIDVDRRKIAIRGEVTGEGIYEAVVKVHPSIATTIKIHVRKE